MRKFFICAGYTVLGFVIGYGLCMIVFAMIMMRHSSKIDPGLTLMVLMPVGFMISSMFSGYFCQPYIRKPLHFVLLSPGLYFSIIPVVGINVSTIKGPLAYESWQALGMFVLILFSTVGVYIGKYLRAKQLI